MAKTRAIAARANIIFGPTGDLAERFGERSFAIRASSLHVFNIHVSRMMAGALTVHMRFMEGEDAMARNIPRPVRVRRTRWSQGTLSFFFGCQRSVKKNA